MSTLAAFAGKYAAFVWPAYAVTGVLFAAMIADTLLLSARARRKVQDLEKESPP